MKRRAIYLDANNDIYTTLGKFERLDAEEVILVIPKSSVLFHSLINFKILKSEAIRRHKGLSIVTVDTKGQQLAGRVGIPVYKDLDLTAEAAGEAMTTSLVAPVSPAATSNRELKIKYKRKLPTSRSINQTMDTVITATPEVVTKPLRFSLERWQLRKDWGKNAVLLSWLAVAVAVLSAVIYLTVPQAKVILEIRSEPFSRSFKLALADKNDKEAAGQNVFKGRFMEVEKKLTQNFPATGGKNNGNPASGTITVYNYTRSVKPVGLRTQTRFQSPDGQIFRGQSEILIASATVGASGKLMPGRTNIRVLAETGGTKGNLNAETKFTIPGLGTIGVDMVYGQNAEPLVGGTDAEVKMVTEEDIKTASDSISKNVFVDAEAELQTKIGKKEELIPSLIQNDIINVTPSVQAGTARDNFDLDISVRSWTLLPEKGKLADIMQTTVNTIVPLNRVLTSQTLRGLQLNLDNADYDNHIIDFTVAIDGAVAPKIDATEIAESLANRSLKSVQTLFDSISDIISHKVTLWPFWVKKMPLLEGNIKIEFTYINQ